MTEIKKISIDEDIISYIQKCQYEMDGLKVLLTQLKESNIDCHDVQQDYLTAYKTHQVAMMEAINKYAPEYADNRYKVEFNYLTNEMKIFKI